MSSIFPYSIYSKYSKILEISCESFNLLLKSKHLQVYNSKLYIYFESHFNSHLMLVFSFHLPQKHYSVPSEYISVCTFFTCPVQRLECNRDKVDTLVCSAIFNFAVVSNSIEEPVITLNLFRVKTQEIYLRLFISKTDTVNWDWDIHVHFYSIFFWHML